MKTVSVGDNVTINFPGAGALRNWKKKLAAAGYETRWVETPIILSRHYEGQSEDGMVMAVEGDFISVMVAGEPQGAQAFMNPYGEIEVAWDDTEHPPTDADLATQELHVEAGLPPRDTRTIDTFDATKGVALTAEDAERVGLPPGRYYAIGPVYREDGRPAIAPYRYAEGDVDDNGYSTTPGEIMFSESKTLVVPRRWIQEGA